MTENEIAKLVVDLALKIHKKLGPGLLESVYEECLFYELTKSGIKVEKQVVLPVIYDSIRIEAGYRIDLKVGEKVIIEIKAVDSVHAIHYSQLLTYLKLSGCKLGLLINFNVPQIKFGIKRVVNNLDE
ncbi:MAG: GxxExxY protein [Bacteroidetes bacterium]|nr:GxxExxY protein [Bacteroidota bacterium]